EPGYRSSESLGRKPRAGWGLRDGTAGSRLSRNHPVMQVRAQPSGFGRIAPATSQSSMPSTYEKFRERPWGILTYASPPRRARPVRSVAVARPGAAPPTAGGPVQSPEGMGSTRFGDAPRSLGISRQGLSDFLLRPPQIVRAPVRAMLWLVFGPTSNRKAF